MRAYVYAAIAAAVLAFAVSWHLSRVSAAEKAVHAHYAGVLAGINEKTAKAAQAFRATEQAWQKSIEGIARDGQDKLDTARRDSAGARSAADSLRKALDRFRAATRTAADPSTAGASETAPDAIGMLADMLSELDRRAGIYAATADAAYAAGVTCEQSHDVLVAR